jgi:DNA-binding MarR family transcriptional regulator
LRCVEVLGQLAGLFEERRRQLAETVGLTVQQWQVLEEITSEHFMPSMFAERRSSSAAAVSKILRQLTDKGIITAQISERDARQRDYMVTPLGKKLLTRVRRERQRAIDEVWLKLDERDLEQFNAVGGHLVQRLDAWAQSNRSGPSK